MGLVRQIAEIPVFDLVAHPGVGTGRAVERLTRGLALAVLQNLQACAFGELAAAFVLDQEPRSQMGFELVRLEVFGLEFEAGHGLEARAQRRK